MISILDIFKVIISKTKKIVWILGLHAFSFIIFLIFVSLVLGGFIFYEYVYLAENEKPNTIETILKFDEKKYQDVLKEIRYQPASTTKNISTDVVQ